jgi:hypothetical protein
VAGVEASGLFDDERLGQQWYEAALREVGEWGCGSCSRDLTEWGFERWVFVGYEDKEVPGPGPRVRVVIGRCQTCGREREDKAERLQDAYNAAIESTE